MSEARSEIRDGMQIEWDAAIPMDDGTVLRADVFRPAGKGEFPVILNYGPYAKGHAFQDSRKFAWERMIKQKPEVAKGTSSKYQNWEVVDPEKWVPDGYAIVRVDARGRPLAGLCRSVVAARNQRPLRMHRVGRVAGVVYRQGRPQRYFLFCDERMAGC